MRRCALLLAMFCLSSAARGSEAEPLLHPSQRALLQTSGLPPICTPRSAIKPTMVAPRCPTGTFSVNAKNPPEKCASCPTGFAINKAATRCLANTCPMSHKNRVANAVGVTGITCCRCDQADAPTFLRSAGGKVGCYSACIRSTIAVPNTSPPECCWCPSGFQVRNSTTCASKVTVVPRPVTFVPTACITRDFVQPSCINVVAERPPTQVNPSICTSGTSLKVAGGLVRCATCPTGGAYPYVDGSGAIACSGTRSGCPSNAYRMCGPYCWDSTNPALATPLGRLSASQCSAAIPLISECVDMC